MQLSKITVNNYRSIEKETIALTPVDGARCFGLLGINESGKTSLLKAISLIHMPAIVNINYLDDCFETAKGRLENIEVEYFFELEADEKKYIKSILRTNFKLTEKVNIETLISNIVITIIHNEKAERLVRIQFRQPTSVTGNRIVFKITDKEGNVVEENTTQEVVQEKYSNDKFTSEAITSKGPEALDKYLINVFSDYITGRIPEIVLWRGEEKYYIPNEALLDEFAANPEEVSIPLKNCFQLAGVERDKIAEKVNILKSNASERKKFEDALFKEVNKHIKNTWKDQKADLHFDITESKISCLVKDEKEEAETSEYIKPSLRSDGFRRMVSFLLTISANNTNGILENTVLLLDEPEASLHPTSQEYLRSELVKIARTKNNIVVYATHSPFMIDRDDLSRNYRVKRNKSDNAVLKTEIEKIDSKKSSYSEINYIVFDIATNDYHNELYGYLHQKFIDGASDKEEEKKRSYILEFDKTLVNLAYKISKDRIWKEQPNGCTLTTYVRNCIDHPENGNKFTPIELERSIKYLRYLKYEK